MERTRRGRRPGPGPALATAALVLLGWSIGPGAWASFTSSANVSATYSSATISITDNDSNTAMLSLSNAKPGDRDTACITVTYTGSIASTVHLYGTLSGSGLGSYAELTVTRGTISSGAFDSCTNFTPDNYQYTFYQPVGTIYQGPLSSFPSTYSSGVVDPDTSGGTESWATNEVHAYKFQVIVGPNSAAAGKNVTASFTFEAR